MNGRATVAEALSWLEGEIGNAGSRKEALERLNDVRRLFYSLYDHARMNFYVEVCLPVQSFCMPCESCGDSYLGITLPPEANQAESMWINRSPIPLYNDWYEYQTFRRIDQSGTLKGIDLGSDFPLQTDNQKPCRMRFTAVAKEDVGKIVRLNFLDSNHERQEVALKLAADGVVTAAHVLRLDKPGGIVLPVDLVGGVIVQNADTNKKLAMLHPKRPVPGFRRIKFTGLAEGDQVFIKATRRFMPVEFDWEVIETDNKLAILDAYRYLKIMAVNSSDAQWLAKAKAHITNVTQYIGADNYANDGGSSIRHLRITPFKRGQSRLRRRQML